MRAVGEQGIDRVVADVQDTLYCLCGIARLEIRNRRGQMSKPKFAAIELRVHEVTQLFESLDPFPFRERDLDKSAAEYIVAWARELPKDHAIRIVVHLPQKEVGSHGAADVAGAFRKYFEYCAGVAGQDLRELFRVGRLSFAIGVTVLVICVVAAQYAETIIGEAPLGRIAQESLIILGWVANWRPLEIFLYDWWPLVRRQHLYRRLAAASVELKALESS